METQMSVAQMAARQLRYLGQSFNCAILVARPRINDSQVLGQHRILDGAFAGGQQLDRALAFADGALLTSKSSINHTEGAESRCIVALIAHHLDELHSRVDKRGTSCRLIATEPGGKTLAPTAREWNVFVETPAPTGRHGGQCALSCVGVALAERKKKPFDSENRRRVWILGQDRLNCRMQRFWICARFEINPGAPYPAGNVFRSYGKRVIQSRGHLLVAVQSLVSKRDLLE